MVYPDQASTPSSGGIKSCCPWKAVSGTRSGWRSTCFHEGSNFAQMPSLAAEVDVDQV